MDHAAHRNSPIPSTGPMRLISINLAFRCGDRASFHDGYNYYGDPPCSLWVVYVLMLYLEASSQVVWLLGLPAQPVQPCLKRQT